MPSTNTLLAVETVADQLGVEPLAVRRLIARGRLKAHRVGPTERGGEPGPWLVKAEALSAYIERGTPDLAPPTIDGGWIRAHDAARLASQFLGDVKAAVEQQFPAEHPGRERVEAGVTDAVRAAMRAESRDFRLPDKTYREFTDAREAYLVAELQRAAREAAREASRTFRPPAEVLYDGPGRYRRITGAAAAAVKEREIVVERWYSEGAVELYLPHTALMTGNATALALAAAF